MDVDDEKKFTIKLKYLMIMKSRMIFMKSFQITTYYDNRFFLILLLKEDCPIHFPICLLKEKQLFF